MNHKIIAIIAVLIFAVSCLSIVSADDNNTTELETIDDTANYIMPISISGNEIEFSDGFTGFCLDSTKESITTEDGFTSQGTGGDAIQNYIKLAIIEAYKQGCEDNLGQIIASFADGSYKNSANGVITAVLESQETVGDSAVVELEDSIEGTFEFELLKSANGDKSDCLAYRVSLKEIPNDDKLAAADEDNATEEIDETNAAATNSSDDNQDTENTAPADNATEEDEQTENSQETIVNETNNTIVNKTNNVIVNETNTTIINQTNVKHINNTTKDTPQKESIPQKLMKTVGNPISILIIVIVIAAIVAVVMRRKD